jgi:type IV pilus assembly protein PilA
MRSAPSFFRSPSRGGNAPSQRGFTQLEAVIVLAATLLIVALVVTAVRAYLVRAEIEESIALAKYAQDQVTRAFRRSGTPPADNASAGVADDYVDGAARYVAEMRVTDGRIDLVFGPDASAALEGRTLSLTPFETADRQVVWVCGSREPGVGLNPLGFAAGGPLATRASTTIDPRYLPPSCR